MSSQINSLKELLHTVTELLFVRFKMARIEFVAQKERMVRLGILAFMAVMLFLMSYISLLFGLNVVLSPVAKVWVFFTLSAVLLLLMIWAFWSISRNLAGQRRFLANTLHELQEDVAYVQGKKTMADWSLKE
ncbi:MULTISPECIES: phage holin family protein [Oceanisphaera]|uniref:Phage holin family protein n=1 Tax=Oceanisphaera ostreae TaxID=914151 RepID=A0ABW3KN78_9GAMM